MDQKFFIQPFAFAGDVATIPEPVQPAGAVSFNQGWGFDYQREIGVDPLAKSMPRAETNYLFRTITDAVGALQRQGAPEFITAANNGGAPFAYTRGAIVRFGTPLRTFVSITDTNITDPTSAANWQPLLFVESTNAEALAGTDGTTVMTPRRVAAAIAASTPTIPDATEAVKGIAELATTAEAQGFTDDSRIITALKLGQAIPAAGASTVGRTRYATQAEVSALTVTNAAVTPVSLTALANSKATLGASVSFSELSVVRTATPTQGYAVFGNAGTQFIGWNGTDYILGGGTGGSVWRAGNFDPALKADLNGPVFVTTAAEFTASSGNGTALRVRSPALAGGLDLGASPSLAGGTDPDVFMYNRNNGAIWFGTSNIIRGKMLAGGVFEWNGKAAFNGATLSGIDGVATLGTFSTRGITGGYQFEARDNAAKDWGWYANAGTTRLNLDGVGDLMTVSEAGVVTATAFDSPSSRELKNIDGPLPYGLAEVLALETAIGAYKPEFSADNRKRLFLIAEQLAEFIPEPVTVEGVEFDGRKVPAVEYAQLIPVLVKALQEEHAARITETAELRERIEALGG